ncbi:hypothetical protein D3OALGA1CA_5463 [Olavius algarvensis associated proteobacterium Delta 3]|nr:hypothetical protein D3OALGA1CA_5463 [Olavius algarvensis associated proteobacterium Delta 3]
MRADKQNRLSGIRPFSHPHLSSPIKGEEFIISLPWGEGLKGRG